MRFLPAGQGFLADGGRPVSPQNAFGTYFDVTGRVPSLIFQGDSLNSKFPTSPSVALVANNGALDSQAFPVGAEGEPNESPLITSAYQYANSPAQIHHGIADDTILDIDGSKSISFSICFRTLNDAFPVNAGAIFGKRQTGGDLIGYELTMGIDGSVTFTHKGADLTDQPQGFAAYNSAAGQHRYADGRLHTFDIEFDITASEVRVGSEHSATDTVPWTLSPMVTGTTFRLGAVRGFAAGPIQIAYLIVSENAQAMKGDPSDTALVLAAETSLTSVMLHNREGLT